MALASLYLKAQKVFTVEHREHSKHLKYAPTLAHSAMLFTFLPNISSFLLNEPLKAVCIKKKKY